NSEGDAIHRADQARSAYGQGGGGIDLGIISDGVDNRASAQASGDLPADGAGLTVLSNALGGDEGTAMLEIVHDLAPDAGLFFHDAGTNIIAFQTAIDNLVA
ncbi:MAG: cell surface protein, partial [Calditrichaeota bacterium]|nr:cell surface protein [Calditrichota bacterium]